MDHQRLVGFVLTPIVLLAIAWLIRTGSLWTSAGSTVLPWLCTALSLALAIVGATCALLSVKPSQIPLPTAACVIGSIMIVYAAGIIVDESSLQLKGDLLELGAEWLGFGAMLAGAFFLPRTMDDASGETRCRRCHHLLRGLKEPRCPECGEAI